MNAALGDAVVSDFDGTLARLTVPWATLRETLAIERIDDLWRDVDVSRWDVVTHAEVEAARTAPPVPAVIDALGTVGAVAVLTSNDETAVETFLDRYPLLRPRVLAVVGRRALRGPKTDFDVFRAGYASCLRAIGADGAQIAVTYIGDMRYELDFARRLGARAVDVTELEVAARASGET